MRKPCVLLLGLVSVLCAFVSIGGVRAEVIEEIVAKVNDDVITKSEFEAAEQESVAEAYRRLSGEQLDRELKRMREDLLRQMINRKVLLHRALRMYDVDKLGQALLESFLEQQGISGNQDLARILAAENMTEEELKERLIEFYAPSEIENYEVRSRVAVSDAEIRAAYDANPERFRVAGEAVVREIVILAGERSREEAFELARSVRSEASEPGADFAKLASGVSEAGTRENGGLLGTVRRGDLSPALEEQAFRLPVGEVSPPLETTYGFHILKVESRTEDRVQPFEEVRETLRQELFTRRYEELYEEFMARAWREADIWIAPKYMSRLSSP